MTTSSKQPPQSRPPYNEPSSTQPRRMVWIWGGLALLGLLIVLAGYVIQTRGATQSVPSASPAQGPRLIFDETVFDFGKVPFNKKVQHEFVFRNSGTEPLRILERPGVEVIQGC